MNTLILDKDILVYIINFLKCNYKLKKNENPAN